MIKSFKLFNLFKKDNLNYNDISSYIIYDDVKYTNRKYCQI